MQKVITVEEMEKTVNEYRNIEEPIIVKREKDDDLIILSLEEYKKKIFMAELDRKIEEGEDDIRNGRVRNAKEVFKELRQKYGY